MCTKPIAVLAGCLGALLLLLGSSLSLAWLLGWTTPRSVPQASELASFDYGTLRPVTVEEKRQWKELGFVVLRGVIDPAAIDIVERESHRLCSWQMWFGNVCQIEEGRWQSDVLRDFLFHSPLGAIVHSFIGGSLRLYQDGLIGLARTWTSPLFYTFLKHVDHSGRPGKYGGLHSDTLGASVWVPLQDIDNETEGGSITLYEGFPHHGCHYRMGEKSTVWQAHDVLDMPRIAKNCARFGRQRGEFTPRVKKGDVVLWWPSMMHNTQPFRVSRTRYALYARVVHNNSVTCLPKDCGWKGRPCCNAELIPKSGSVIDTPCYPQIFPSLLERELAAHFGSEPQPLVEPGGYSTMYGLDQKRLKMGSTCRRNLRMPSLLEMSLERNYSSKADAGNQTEIDVSNVEEFFCQERLGEPDADLRHGRCFAVSRGGPVGSAGHKGLPARKSKALQDIDWNYTVPWGRDLWGVDDGDGWVEVSSFGAGALYFPVSTGGARHLERKELCGSAAPDLCDAGQLEALLSAHTARFRDLRQEVEDVHRALEALDAELQQARDALQARVAALTAERSGALTRSSGALGARARDALDPSVPTNGMVSWFKMEEAGREWPSSVGSYSGQEIQGPLEVVRHWRRGAPRPVTYLRGSNATKFIFGHVIHDTFSICSASRYEAGQHGRVLQGSRTNWLHGHHAGRAGVAFYERWMTPQRAHGVPPGVKSTSLDWIVMCATNAARRAYANSTSVAVDGPAPDSGHQSLGVNVGATMRGELTAAGDVPSDWAVAEVITWNRELSDREMLDVSAYLQRKLEGRGDEGKAVGPKPAPEASGQSGNELADIRKQDKRLKDRGRREKAKIKGQGFFLRKQVLFERARDREGCSTSSPQDCDNETSRELDGYMALEPDVLEAAYLREKHTLDVVMAAELQRAKKDLAARARAARKNLSEAGRRISELPFAADGLAAWFRSEDAAAAWPSAVGTHVGRTIMGEVTARRMNGPQRRHMRALSGSRMASFRFGQVLAERFTLCSATRYSGSHRQRILVGEQHDLVHGHWRNYAGVAFYRGWATDPRPAEREGYDKWMVMCGTNAALRQYVNGVNHAVNATFRGGNQSLAINSGIMQGDERSDWEAAEIIAWDRALSDEEMLQASKYLLGKLQSGASQNETVLRRQLAEFREVDENVAKIMDVIAASELEVESKIDDKRRQVLRMRKAWLHLKRAQVLCSPWDLSLCSPDEGTTLQDALSARMEDLVSNIAAKFGSVRELRAHVEWQRQNALVNADSMARTKALLDEPFEKYSVGRHCPHKGMKKKFYLYTGIPKIPCQSLCLETPACVFATWFSSGFCQLSKTCSPDARASDPSAVTIKIPSRLSQNKSKQKVQAQMSNYKRLEENLGKHREVQMRLESDIAQAVHRLETQQDSLELLNLARWRRLATEPKQASARTLPQSKQPPAKSSPQPPAKAHPQPKKPLAKAHPQPKQQPAKTPPQPKKPPAKASPQPKQLLKASQQSPAKTSPRPPEVSVGGRPKEPIPQDGGGRDLPQAGDVQELILSCNKDGMEHLRRGEHKEAFEQFKYAEAVLLGTAEPDCSALLAVTCNNLGCYYKKVGKFHGALSYLRRALKMEVELRTDEVTLAGTHLNLCAVLSKLEKHDKAVQHSLCALELMSKHVSAVDTDVSQDDYAVLAIAYHNVAMEREFLEQWDQAATASIDGFQVAKRLLGENHPLSITLGTNCEAVLKKAKAKKGAVPHMHGLGRDRGGPASPEDGEDATQPGGLKARTVTEKIRLPALVEKEAKAHTREEAADWVKNEENLWTQFAQRALGTGPGPRAAAAEDALAALPEAEGALKVPQLLAQSLRAMRDQPSADEPSMLRPITVYDTGNLGIESMLKRSTAKHTPLAQAMEDKPEALMDIMDAELHSQVSMRAAPNEIRPNRSMKRLTRTTKVLRKTGNFCSTDNRDRVQAEIEKRRADRKAIWKDPKLQRFAAEKIQRVWRSWYAYCQENAEWMTITWICATMIQSHWRSYHVRRLRMDRAACDIQRHIRGFLVRNVLKRHTAAVTIQRRVVGIQTRAKIAKLHEHATTIQRLVRGGLARHYCTDLRAFQTDVATIIQKHVRAYQARCRVLAKRSEKQKADTLLKATTDLQRMFRGWKGRQHCQIKSEERELYRARSQAATVIQCSVRRVQAKKRVDCVRSDRDEEMAKAVTFVRKVWLGRQARRRLQAVKESFEANPEDIITLQRYLRGCIVRVRLWREAVQTEEKLWAAIEIQRAWRGYAGRVAWELLYETIWRRELAAATIQRNTRMGLARLKVRRMQRALARAEFEKARNRFRAAVRLQALARGVLLRRRHRQRVVRESRAAVAIQRIHRGRSTRQKIWDLVVEQKATLIAANIRGWLIRRRMANFTRKVIYLQRRIRRHRELPAEVRGQRVQQSRHRREQASKIARFYRQFADAKRAKNIRAPASEASTAEPE